MVHSKQRPHSFVGLGTSGCTATGRQHDLGTIILSEGRRRSCPQTLDHETGRGRQCRRANPPAGDCVRGCWHGGMTSGCEIGAMLCGFDRLVEIPQDE